MLIVLYWTKSEREVTHHDFSCETAGDVSPTCKSGYRIQTVYTIEVFLYSWFGLALVQVKLN